MAELEEEHKRSARAITDSYAVFLERPLPHVEAIKRGLPPGATWADAIAFATIRTAADGDQQAAREIRESIEGRAPARAPEPAVDKITVQIINVAD
jgi:hypothetical protein